MKRRFRSVFYLVVVTILSIGSVTTYGQGKLLTPEQALEKLEVAEGLQVVTFASDPEIVSISNIDVDHRGRVWACESMNYRGHRGKRPEGDRILILEDINGDGVSDKTTVFYQGTDVDIAMGLCVLGNKAIVACAPDILLLEDTNGDDRADKKSVLFTSDAVFQHDHSLHSFVFGPDGRFYGNFGNTGRALRSPGGKILLDRMGLPIRADGKPYWGGMVFRSDRTFKEVEVLGHNFRNNYEATVDSFGGVWQSDNDDDGNLAVRLNYILAGGNYGYLDEFTGERWMTPRIGAHPHRGKRHWHLNDPGAMPNVIETGNGAPTGVTVYEGDLLPDIMQDQVIFCEAGGHVVWSLPVTPDGAGFTATKVDILRSPDPNFRPTDAAVAPDGSLFISDWYDPVIGGFQQADTKRGRIYWIAPKGHAYRPKHQEIDDLDAAIASLRNPNYCTRYLAWIHLHQAGAAAELPLSRMLSDKNPRMRARALWLLGQIPGREKHYIDAALQDADQGIRIVGLRLADLHGNLLFETIERLTNDEASHVRAECAVLLRSLRSSGAVELWAQLARTYEAGDRWFLEALGIGADGKWDACMAALGEGIHPDLIWRSRGANTPALLAERIQAQPEGSERYLRAFDFQADGPIKNAALKKVASISGLKAAFKLEAIQRLDSKVIAADPQTRQTLGKLITAQPASTKSVDLVKQHNLTLAYPWLLETARNPHSEVRADAIAILLEAEQMELISSSLADSKTSFETANALAVAGHSKALSLLKPYFSALHVTVQNRKETARIFARSKVGAEMFLKQIESNELSEEMQQAIASVLLIHGDQAIRIRAEKLLPVAADRNAEALPNFSQLLTMKGNADRGRDVFTKEGICATCHTIGNDGSLGIGPDLMEVGTKLARPALFEAILFPSAAISHGYENYVAEMKDGRAYYGTLASQNKDQVQIRDALGTLHTLKRLDLESLDQLSLSLMPANLHQLMTTQQLVDLVAYLETLKRK